MKRTQLNDLSVFVEVARAGGFRAAAERLRMGPASVSEAVQRIEDRLAVRLFERTTRKIALTTVGEKLFRQSLPAIEDLEGAIRELDDAKGMVSGVLRLSAPRNSGKLFLNELVAKYVRMFPEVQIELIFNDRKVDLVSSGVDAVIRPRTLLEPNTHAVPVGPNLEMSIVASPDYLRRKGLPKSPHDLVEHDGICFTFEKNGDLAPWNFLGDEGVYALMPKAKLVLNEIDAMLNFAESGFGFTYIFSYAAAPLIRAKKLVPFFDDQIPALPRYTINYLTKRHMPARLRSFIDLAKTI